MRGLRAIVLRNVCECDEQLLAFRKKRVTQKKYPIDDLTMLSVPAEAVYSSLRCCARIQVFQPRSVEIQILPKNKAPVESR